MSRQRTRSWGVPGSAEYVPNNSSLAKKIVSNQTSRSYITDEFGLHDMPFRVNHVSSSGFLSGAFPPNRKKPYRELVNFMPTYLEDMVATSVQHLDLPDLPSPAAAAVHVMNATNPSRPTFDLPVSILELRELPGLIRSTGRTIIKTFAKKDLSYEFGLAPLANDLLNLLKFKESVDKQMDILKRFQDGPVVRKALVGASSAQTTPGTLVNLESRAKFFINARLDMKTTNATRWGYVTWTPTIPDFRRFFGNDATLLRAIARKIVAGFTIDYSTAWESIPWSWLIDWFSNIGDYLASKRSLIPVSAGVPSICTTTVTTESYSNRNNDFGWLNGQFTFSKTLITKSRSKNSAALPSAFLPLLTPRQVRILTSLAVLKTR